MGKEKGGRKSMSIVAVHIRDDSRRRPEARLSFYLQRHQQGISWKMFGITGVFVRQQLPDRVLWVRFLAIKDHRMRHAS
jgi:hypothetical protein